MSTWVNFAELRERLLADDVLAYYKIALTRKPNTDQAVGQCPLPKHGENKAKCFSVNLAKGLWQCFGCKESGNLLDLACYMEGKDKAVGREVRQVALKLHQHFFGKPAPKPPKEPLPKEPPRQHAPRQPPPKGLPRVVNPPLDFSLKTLERDHPFFAANKITSETAERFGLGFCKRGALTGRIAIPLHDDAEQLVGYAGLSVETEQKPGVPKYLFPASREVEGAIHVFDAGAFLYNGSRLKSAVKDLIVVRECESVWMLWQGGFANVVAVMGDECSEDQAELIGMLTTDNSRVWLLTDRSGAGEHCAKSLLPKVATSRLCRWVRVPTSADIAPDHPLLAALPKR